MWAPRNLMRLEYIEKQLEPGEEINYSARAHWVVMLPGTLIAAVLGVTGVGLCGNHGLLRALAAMLMVTSMMLYTIVLSKRAATEIALTNRRLLFKEGLANYRSTETLLSEIDNVTVVQSALGRILGYGTVIVLDKAGNYEQIIDVENPKGLQTHVERQKHPADTVNP